MKKVFPTLFCFLKVIGCSVKTVSHPVISILAFIIDKAYVFSGNLVIGTHDKTLFFKLFESGHHRNTDEDPLGSGGFCALS